MKPKKRQKLCHNCEGDIDVDVIVCPFCAADLREERPEQKSSAFVSTTRQMTPRQTSESLYPSSQPEIEKKEEKNPVPIAMAEWIPTVSLTLGIQLGVFGLFLLVFSHQGIVALKWDATMWFMYLIFATPLLVFGWKKTF